MPITASFPDLVAYLNAFDEYSKQVKVNAVFIDSTGHPSAPSIPLGVLNLQSWKEPFKAGAGVIVVNSVPDSSERIALSLNKVAYLTVHLDTGIAATKVKQVDFYMI
jgi:hypothetical protein